MGDSNNGKGLDSVWNWERGLGGRIEAKVTVCYEMILNFLPKSANLWISEDKCLTLHREPDFPGTAA